MLFSRPLLFAAVLSSSLHIGLLGIAAGLLVTHGRATTAPLKVTLVQPAIPLPVGDFKGPETGGAHPEEKPLEPASPPPPPQPKPETPEPRKTAPPKPRTKKPSPPKTVATPATVEAPPQPATMTLPLPQEGRTDGANTTDENVGGKQNAKDESRSTVSAASGAKTPRGGGGLSARPDYGVNPKPLYPMLARRRGEQGVVLLRIHVRADGSVAEAEIKQSSGSTLLNDSALRTVRESWRFVPARLDGVPVESWVEVPIRFVLGDA